jgi:hypothetical protein
MLSMLSFTAMRTIATQSGGDLPTSAPATQSVATNAPAPQPKGAKPAEPKLQGVPPAVSGALASGKVVVLLFTEKGGAEDAASAGHYGALSGLGGVRAFRAGISDLRRYAGIVAQVGLSQAPAAVIVRPDLTALPPIEGYVDSQYLVQRVKDQLR